MIVCAALLLPFSLAFFVVWQYWDSPVLVAAYLFSLTALFFTALLLEKRKNRRVLLRLQQVLEGGGGTCITEESLTPTERQVILRLAQLEAREIRVQGGYRKLSSLVADIAHQSKTPLSAILMYTELMEADEAAVIRTQTERLRFLMDALTKLAKCEGGLIEENLSLRLCPVKELLRQGIGGHFPFPLADKKGITIRCDVEDGLLARFDLRWTAEAIGNLFDNAVKYGPAGSEITVTARDCDVYVRIDVTDQGPGIPEEELTKIWKRFYRGKNVSSESGVGIGLYLTSCILHAEGGRVFAKSSPSGSTFSVFLSKL